MGGAPRSDPAVRPVFLISLPRSGSTLLQKMLAVSPRVCTVAEPWVMLPLGFMLRDEGTRAWYYHGTYRQALADLLAELPGGRDALVGLMGDLGRGLYGKLAREGQTHFLDKTPRYYLIVPFLAEAFPEARFVFLFRHPLEVLASVFTTWCGNRIGPRLNGSYTDLMVGPGALAAGCRDLKERALAVHYGDLVTEPEATVKAVCAHADIPFQDDMLTAYRSVRFSGAMGDPTGVASYEQVSTESLEKWKTVLGTRYRKWFARRYLRSLGDEALSEFGLSTAQVVTELDAIPGGWHGFAADLLGHVAMTITRLGQTAQLRNSLEKFVHGEHVLPCR